MCFCVCLGGGVVFKCACAHVRLHVCLHVHVHVHACMHCVCLLELVCLHVKFLEKCEGCVRNCEYL